MRRSIALLVVLMMTLGPFAQGVDLGEVPTLTPPEDVEFEMPGIEPTPDAAELLSNIDGFFTENLGQKGEGAGLFYCMGNPLSVAFDTDWVTYDFRPVNNDLGAMFRISYEGSNGMKPIGILPLSHENNYFIGNDPEQWVTGARNFKRVVYEDIYDGIDLVYRFTPDSLKYDFIVDPYSDPEEIIIDYHGIEALDLDEGFGDLMITTAAGTIRDQHPIAYQDLPSERSEVKISFEILDDTRISFDIDEYDIRFPLIIDPGLVFSTYVGGNNYEEPSSIAIDSTGNTVISGTTNSRDFPTTTGAFNTTINGGYDGFILKLNNSGSALEFGTYFGGSGGDHSYDIELDSYGNIYATGMEGVYFIVRSYDTLGNYRWTYWPGQQSWGYALVYGNDGNIYAVGRDGYSSPIFKVISLTCAGDTNWTYSGSGNGNSEGRAIVYGLDDKVYTAGWSTGISRFIDLTVIRLDTTGTEDWIYRYNGSGDRSDKAYSIVYGLDHNIYAAGCCYDSITDNDFLIIGLDTTTIGVVEKRTDPASNNIKYPNILSGPLILPEGKECRVLDITGRVVRPDRIKPGIYFIEVDGVIMQKVVKIR